MNIKRALNNIYTAKRAKRAPIPRLHDHTIGGHVLAVASELGLYDVEPCHDSGGIRITFAATLTPAEVEAMRIECASSRIRVYGPSPTVRGIVSAGFTREAVSK